jgi:hypothetical protein
MDEIRDALRDGLREEAAPISRRLAEVKGLSNNAIRRLERLEGTLESERHARVDDLALLVDLLTDGWRSLNARLDRIESLLAARPEQAVRPEQRAQPEQAARPEQAAQPEHAAQPTPSAGAEVYRLPTAG